jgi:hypothetical protein
MELRHLRYFVAVAEAGSLTVAAEKRLHTAQPSLSRQMRDLELEVGVSLLVRNARGIDSPMPVACFSIMLGLRCCKSAPRAKPPGVLRGLRKRRSCSAFSPGMR